MKLIKELNEAKTAVIAPGREIVVNYRGENIYAQVQRIEGDQVYLTIDWRKKPVKFHISDISVETNRGFEKAKLK